MNEIKGFWEFKTHVVFSIIIVILSTITDLIATGGTTIHLSIIGDFFAKSEGSSVGIIGGADGPTAIFLSGSPVDLFIYTKILLLLLLVILYFPTRKYMNKLFVSKTKKHN